MNFIRQHTDTLHQIKVPLPFPLLWVNSYLLRGKNGYTLIDPGLRTAAAEQCWEQVLHELGIAYRDIEQIVLTHHHPDHYGLAGWFQERSTAPVRMSSIGYEQAQLLWGEGHKMTASLLELFHAHGLPVELAESMKAHLHDFVAMVSPQPQVSLIRMGEPLRLGDHDYATIHTPGHAAGHVCFYREETKEMLCGDQVIAKLTPNVSYLPGGIDENPLSSFLQSLADLSLYDVALAYPGHREPFAAFALRAQELIAHHEARLAIMRQALTAQPRTTYQVCRDTFGDKLSMHQLRFALSETLAHLIYLLDKGALQQSEQDGIVHFQAI